MKGKIIIGLMCIILSISLICAASFTPQGNITMRNVYGMENATSITIGNGTVYINPSGFFGWLNWSWLTNIPTYVSSMNQHVNTTADVKFNSLNTTGNINTQNITATKLDVNGTITTYNVTHRNTTGSPKWNTYVNSAGALVTEFVA